MSDEAQKNVVDFGAARRAPSAALGKRGQDILRQIQTIAQHRMGAVATSVFQQVDDALFDLADRAGSSGAQQQFFDGMREIRRKRQRVEDWYHKQIDQAFIDYAAGRTLAAANAPSERDDGELSLSLVEDAELEESLALTSMAGRAEQHLSTALHQLNHRLASLFGREGPDELTPMSPRVLCQAFVTAVRELDVTLQVRLILLKLFERHFVSAEQSACDDANRLLIEAGILPQLRFKAPQRRGAPATAGAPGSAMPNVPLPAGMESGAGAFPGSGSNGVAAEIAQELYSQLQSLLHARRAATHPHAGMAHAPPGFVGPVVAGYAALHGDGTPATSGAAGGAHTDYEGESPELSANELLHALTLLQDESNKIGATPIAAARDFKQALVHHASRLSGSPRARMRTHDEDAIDLVGMLFEFLVEDRQLPGKIQSMLTRLQIPVLRAALLDRQMFTQKTHPARRLLDALAEAGVGWNEAADKDQRLYNKIREVVDTLLGEFNDDVAVFDRLNEDFTGFVTTQRRRAELAEQRAAEAARGREKLEAARHEAGRIVARALLRKGLPEVVREVLSGPWTKYLEIVHARRGPESPEWRAATKLVEDLVWSVDRETVLTESKHWAAMLPSIDATLKQGLGAVGFHEADTHRVLAKLRETYAGVMESARLGGSASVGGIVPTNLDGAANEDPATDEAATLELTSPPGGRADPSGDPIAKASPPAEEMAAHIDAARALKVSQWVELEDETAGALRAKLSWVSAITHRYLFVNQNGLKVAELTLQEVALQLKAGKMRVLEDNPLFDRALSAIVKRLRSA